jgi:hypothetical protein
MHQKMALMNSFSQNWIPISTFFGLDTLNCNVNSALTKPSEDHEDKSAELSSEFDMLESFEQQSDFWFDFDF